MKRVSKIILLKENYFIFSIKKAPKRSEKHKKLEFFGGQVEEGETPFEGLVRELTEEECSGVLARKAVEVAPEHQEIEVSDYPHFIYTMTLTNDDLADLDPCPEESFGYRLIRKNIISKSSGMVTEKEFTPKTVSILKKLKMI